MRLLEFLGEQKQTSLPALIDALERRSLGVALVHRYYGFRIGLCDPTSLTCVERFGNGRSVASVCRRVGLTPVAKMFETRNMQSKNRQARLRAEALVWFRGHFSITAKWTVHPRVLPFLRADSTSMLVLADYLYEFDVSPRHAKAIRRVGGDVAMSIHLLQHDL